MKVTISVFYAKKEFLEFSRLFFKYHHRKKFVLLTLIAIIFLGIAVFFLFLSNYLGALLLFIQTAIYLALLIGYRKEKIMSVTDNPDNRFLFTQYDVILTETFLSTNSNFGFTKVKLDYLSKIVQTKNYIAFYHHTLPILLLNKNELDVVDRNEIDTLLNRHYYGEVIKIDD